MSNHVKKMHFPLRKMLSFGLLGWLLVGPLSCVHDDQTQTVSDTKPQSLKTAEATAELSYFVRSPWFQDVTDQFFKDSGWTKIPSGAEHDCVDKRGGQKPVCCSETVTDNCMQRPGWPPTLVYANGTYATKYSRNVAGVEISNRFTRPSAVGIADKEVLFQRLRERDEVKPYLPRQVKIDYSEKGKALSPSVASFLKDIRFYIMKPTDGYGGHGIKVAQSDDDSQRDIDEHMEANKNEYTKWVLQEYLGDPLLYNGKKFHLRMYALVIRSLKNDETKVFTYPESWVYTAPEPYGTPMDALANLGNSRRHITNISAGGQGAPFPHAFKHPEVDQNLKVEPLKTTISQQFNHLVWESLRKEKVNLRCLPGLKTGCFDILGYDIMVDRTTSQLKMLEINLGVGFNFVKYDKTFEQEWRRRFVADLLETVLKTLLDNDVVKTSNSKFELLTEESVKKLPEAIEASKKAAQE